MILELCECQMSLFINSVLYIRRRDRHRRLMKNRPRDVKERLGTALEWSASICHIDRSAKARQRNYRLELIGRKMNVIVKNEVLYQKLIRIHTTLAALFGLGCVL